jgi:biotin transporter BioY
VPLFLLLSCVNDAAVNSFWKVFIAMCFHGYICIYRSGVVGFSIISG